MATAQTLCTVIVCCPYCRHRNVAPGTGPSLLFERCSNCGHILEFYTAVKCAHCAETLPLKSLVSRKPTSGAAVLACPRCHARLADGIPARPFQPSFGRYLVRLALSRLRSLIARLFGRTAPRYDLRACNILYNDLNFSWKRESLALLKAGQVDYREQENERTADMVRGGSPEICRSRETVWARHVRLLENHQHEVNIMLRLANGKIFKDEYGDENWKGAQKDLETVIEKLADREESADIGEDYSIEFLVRCDTAYREAYSENWLADELLDRLEAYHREQAVTDKPFDIMSGVEFDEWIIKNLKEAGIANVLPTKRTADQGADIIVEHNNIRIAIQAKCYQKSVGNDAVQQIYGAKAHYQAQQAWVVTNSRFTPAARRLANSTGVQLVDGSRVYAIGHLVAGALGLQP